MSKDVKTALISQIEKLEIAAEQVCEHLNDIYDVKSYMTRRVNDQELTPRQQELLTTYEFSYNQLISGKYSEQEVVEMIQRRLKCGRSEALAMMRESKDLFASSFRFNKQWYLLRQVHLNEMYQHRAKEMGDLKALAAFEKNGLKLAEMIEEVKDAPEEFKGHVLNVSANPKLLGVKMPNKKDVDDLLKMLKDKFDHEVEDAQIIDE